MGLYSPARADEIPEKYKDQIRKGLDWLAKNQQKDGHWAANGDHHPVAMTGLAGLAMLMEGSTVRDGKYATNIRKAVEWIMDRSQKGNRNGLLGNPDHPSETGRYMYGHGFGLLFLASVYGDEEDRDRRDRLKDILTRAVKYTGNAQSTQGGWYYTSKQEDGHDSDEGSVTVTQMQGLRACREAGIPVNKDIMKKGYDYLKKSTTQRGGVVYSLGRGGFGGAAVGGERPALTAAAIACLFSAGEYKDEHVKKWFKYCETAVPITNGFGGGHDEYTQFYYAPSVYFLGEDGWARLFPDSAADKRLTWSKYKEGMFGRLASIQTGDGSWQPAGGWSVGPVFSTSVALCIMQLDNNVLPIYQPLTSFRESMNRYPRSSRSLPPWRLASSCCLSPAPPRPTRFSIPRETIRKGLAYLIKNQHKDGHWGANGDTYPVTMTALSGMALLMEGSTVRDGKYSTNIRLCADWLMDRSMKGGQRDGLIGNPNNPTEAARYMYGHGFGLLFLACVYGEENDVDRRERLKDLLTRAVKYTGYAHKRDNHWRAGIVSDMDEGSVTITQVQALRLALINDIPVPKAIIKKAPDAGESHQARAPSTTAFSRRWSGRRSPRRRLPVASAPATTRASWSRNGSSIARRRFPSAWARARGARAFASGTTSTRTITMPSVSTSSATAAGTSCSAPTSPIG